MQQNKPKETHEPAFPDKKPTKDEIRKIVENHFDAVECGRWPGPQSDNPIL